MMHNEEVLKGLIKATEVRVPLICFCHRRRGTSKFSELLFGEEEAP